MHWGKSITVSFPVSLIIKLNSLKSPCIRPYSANFTTNLRDYSKIDFIEHFYPILLIWHIGSPSTNDIKIACRLVSIGIGVGNLF